jgi:hypothetical protein
MQANAAHHWRRASTASHLTETESRRPVHEPGSVSLGLPPPSINYRQGASLHETGSTVVYDPRSSRQYIRDGRKQMDPISASLMAVDDEYAGYERHAHADEETRAKRSETPEDDDT